MTQAKAIYTLQAAITNYQEGIPYRVLPRRQKADIEMAMYCIETGDYSEEKQEENKNGELRDN